MGRFQLPRSARKYYCVMGFLPRFANPHFVEQFTQLVSRADLEAEHDVPHEVEDGDQAVVKTLENILKRSLGEFQVCRAEPERGDARHKKRQRKNKTRDDEKTEPATRQQMYDEQVEVVEFRLLSKATKAVSLKPKPAPQIVTMEPSWEEDEPKAALRAERARAAAVDVSWIMEESRKVSYLPANANKKHIIITAEQLTPIAEMAVFEVLKPTPQASALLTVPLNVPAKERPSPHDFLPEKICCPVISATVLQVDRPQRKHKPRHKKKIIKLRPPPSFWRPLREWGGKSLGYAMGYEGSRPVPTGSVRQRRYRRDTMKRGVLVA
ncbi:uncharacterized protein PHACADRAFT_193507 [Phanerochaete carnosa HHB-10118-sp]|uniref:Uncharacterized protein n=1 Tax=Phanerochaete carnosa (strain HHB-10118-sp) TaxID=650164 RepID=K5W3F5_PHACS|nr:uncharacterized protein PHACADRAFT_193507 [Phanerochaete carnosa HHB-10118-sp]EKM58388.1 hypothetical protein PHACADRAFT_193507 [Phanerochaete carnosa HHB-10118-sp]